MDFAKQVEAKLAEQIAARSEGTTGVSFLLGSTLIVGDAELVELVLQQQETDFYKDSPVKALLPVLTDSMPFLGNHPEWEGLNETHPLTMREFGPWLARQAGPMRRGVRRHSAGWAAGDDATRTIWRMTLEAWGPVIAGVELGDEAWAEFEVLADEGDRRMSSLLPIPEEVRKPGFRKARGSFWARFTAAVKAARRDPDAGDHLLGAYLRCDDRLDDVALRTELANVYFGGLFSSSSALCTALHYLTRDERLRIRVRNEVAGASSAAELARCTLLDGVIRESLRLHTPVSVWLRSSDPEREVTVGQYTLKPDSSVWLVPDPTHLHPERWPDPRAFRPERWTDEVKAANPYGCGWFYPFGIGPRSCSGAAWALTWLRVALAELVEGSIRVGAGQELETFSYFACRAPRDLAISRS